MSIYLIAELKSLSISGAVVDYIDMYFNLKKYIPCKLIILIDYKYITYIKSLLHLYFSSEMVNKLISCFRATPDEINENDIIITKINIITHKYLDINKYNNVIILVGWDFTYRSIFNEDIDYLYHKNIKRYLATPFIKKYINNNSINRLICPYYNKLSEYRLANVKISNKYNLFDDYDNYENLKTTLDFNIHQYRGINYHRHAVTAWNTNNTISMEIKGKLIFEFLYFNKYVHYSPLNKSFDDGLTDYLSIFNIDDNIEQDLNISKDEIYDKLVKFDENDELLNYLTSIS